MMNEIKTDYGILKVDSKFIEQLEAPLFVCASGEFTHGYGFFGGIPKK